MTDELRGFRTSRLSLRGNSDNARVPSVWEDPRPIDR